MYSNMNCIEIKNDTRLHFKWQKKTTITATLWYAHTFWEELPLHSNWIYKLKNYAKWLYYCYPQKIKKTFRSMSNSNDFIAKMLQSIYIKADQIVGDSKSRWESLPSGIVRIQIRNFSLERSTTNSEPLHFSISFFFR